MTDEEDIAAERVIDDGSDFADVEWTATAKRVRITLFGNDGEPSWADTLDPFSEDQRRRAFDKIRKLRPAVDIDELTRRMLRLAHSGPPKLEPQKVTVEAPECAEQSSADPECSSELEVKLEWFGQCAKLALMNGDAVLYVDKFDPRAETQRRKAIEKLQKKYPNIDPTPIEANLLTMANNGPPPRADSAGTAVDADPEPWPEAVDGATLLDELADLLRRYIVLIEHSAIAIALWILHTYCFEVFEYTPRLLLNSPVKRCGKTRLLRMVTALSRRPLSCENITPAALFRSIEKFHPTLLLDEADTFLVGRDANEELRGVVNAGHQRGGKVLRCVPVGDTFEPMPFCVFAPMAIAMIGRPPGTVEDRSIPVPMRRRLPGERVEKHKPGQSLRTRFEPLLARCVRWALDNHDVLSVAEPAVPGELDDRAADCWFALLAIADQAGGRWPHLAREAAVAVMAGRDAKDSSDSFGVMLLRDLKDLFTSQGVDKMSSAGICATLATLADRPWSEFRSGRPISVRNLARLLEPFEIESKNIRTPEGAVLKGYFRSDFEDAWSRYLAQSADASPSSSATALQPVSDKELERNGSATPSGPVADRNRRNGLQGKACSGVALPVEGVDGAAQPQLGPAMACRLCDSEIFWCGTGAWNCPRCHPPLEGRALWHWDSRTFTCTPWRQTPTSTEPRS